MAATEAELAGTFARIGEDASDRDLLSKCLSLCQRFSISAGDLANHWESFAMNHDGKKFDTGSWASFESDVIKSKSHTPSISSTSASTPGSRKSHLSRSSPGAVVTPRATGRRAVDIVTSIDLGSSPPSAGMKRPPLPFATPDPKVARVVRQGEDSSRLSPTSVQSPPDLIRPVYANRNNAGQTTSSHNPKLGMRGKSVLPSPRREGTRCDVVVEETVGAPARYRYMYTPLEERAAALERDLLSLQAEMTNRFGLQEVIPVGVPRQEQVVTVGRIYCDSSEGKINRASILLEGSRRDSGGQRVHLDLREVPSFALFPGQVVAVQGVNASGGRMVCRGIIQGVPRPLATSSPADLMRFQHGAELGGGKPLSIFVASGPFTTSDSLAYEPMNDLLGAVREARPDVVILIGPFVDAEHPQVAAGDAMVECLDGTLEPVDFETLFKLRVSDKLNDILANDENLPTQFVLVPSLGDVFHDFVFPQPPFYDRVEGGMKLGDEDRMYVLDVPRTGGVRKRVHLAPNPAWLRVNEVTIGVNSMDTLKELSGEEVSAVAAGGNRMSRLAEHMLRQQSFYPLFPPPEASAAQLDMRHAQRWRMPATPDVLLLPSKLAHFTREVQGCLCVNPGQMAKGVGGGSYAELAVHPIKQEVLAKAQEELADKPEATIRHDVANRTCVEIRRI